MQNRLKVVRESKSLTLQDLSHLTGLSYQYLWRIEKGEHSPSGLTIDKLCTVLNVKINEIFSHETYNCR